MHCVNISCNLPVCFDGKICLFMTSNCFILYRPAVSVTSTSTVLSAKSLRRVLQRENVTCVHKLSKKWMLSQKVGNDLFTTAQFKFFQMFLTSFFFTWERVHCSYAGETLLMNVFCVLLVFALNFGRWVFEIKFLLLHGIILFTVTSKRISFHTNIG